MLVQRVDRSYVAAGRLLTAAAGYGILTQVHQQSPLWFVLFGASVYAGGVVGAMTVGNELIMGAVPPDRAGAAAAVVETSSEFGGALGMAVLGSIGVAVYRSELAASAPARVPAAALGSARSTLAGALSAAAELPGRLGADLVTAARVAFIHGLNVAALGAAITMIVAAVVSARYFRGIQVVPDSRPASERAEPQPEVVR